MDLREKITIKAAPERIWMLLADPTQWIRWNPKFVSVRRSRSGPVVAGEQFGMVTRLKRSEDESEIQVREVMPLRRVIVRQLSARSHCSREVEVNMELSAGRNGIEVTRTVSHKNAGIRGVASLLMWLIHRIGWPTETLSLSMLKVLAEHPA